MSARVDGHLAFDALFQFSPFYFIIEVSASVSLKVFGVGLLQHPPAFRASRALAVSRARHRLAQLLLLRRLGGLRHHLGRQPGHDAAADAGDAAAASASSQKAENWKAELPSEATCSSRCGSFRKRRARRCCIRSARCASASAPCRSI